MSGLVAIILASSIVATIIFLVPVDPARMSFGQRLESKTLKATQEKYGLNEPLSVQLMYNLRDLSPIVILKEDHPMLESYHSLLDLKFGQRRIIIKAPYFRQSYQSGRPVWDILIQALPQTIVLALLAILLAAPIGILLGMISSKYVGSIIDQFLVGISVLGYSVPSYVSALFFSLLFGFVLGDITGLPVQGSLVETDYSGASVLRWSHVILPAIALGIRPIAVIMQITRSSFIGEMKSNYVRTALSKGLSINTVLVKHILKNAINPVITSVSGWFAALIAGSFFVESIFNYNGIGKVTVNALVMFDVPVLIGSIVVISAIYVLVNIATDLTYRMIDSRMSLK